MAALRLAANAFVRAAPSAAAEPLGLARRGDALIHTGETAPGGWLRVDWRGGTGWVWSGLTEGLKE